MDATNAASAQTLTQPSVSDDRIDAGDGSGVVPVDAQEIVTVNQGKAQVPNLEDGVPPTDVSLSAGNQDGAVGIGAGDLEADSSGSGDGRRTGNEVLERIAENNTGVDENGADQVNELHMPQSGQNQDLRPSDENMKEEGFAAVGTSLVLKASDESVVAGSEVVEEVCASFGRGDQNMDAQIEKKDCDSLDGTRNLGGHAMGSDVFVLGKPEENQTAGSHACEVGVSVGEKKEIEVLNGDSKNNGLHMPQSDPNKNFPDEEHKIDLRPDDEYLKEEGLATVSADSFVQAEVLKASDESVVAEEQNADADVSKKCASVEENQVMGARVEKNDCYSLDQDRMGGNAMESGVSVPNNPGEKQSVGGRVCEVGISVDTGNGKIVETCASEVGVSVRNESPMCSRVIDLGTTFDDNKDNNAGSHVPEVLVSVLTEIQMNPSPAVDMDTSLDTDRGKIVDTCGSEVGASVLCESSTSINLSTSVVMDEKKIAGTDLSEVGFPQPFENQIVANPAVDLDNSLGINDKKIAGTNVLEVGFFPVSELHMMNSSAEHLETHIGTDEKQLAGTHVPEVGVSLLSGNDITGCLGVDLSASLSTGKNLNAEIEITMGDISQPVDFHSNGGEDKEMETNGDGEDKEIETSGKLSLIDENTKHEAEAGNDGTLEKADVGAIPKSIIAEKQSMECASLGTASIKKDFQASYSLPQEKKGEFSLSDLIWGKVRSHPWWPGQIFNPSDSSELALKYKKKDGTLVAYFGDRTFAWCEVSQLKPFRTHFPHMERQSTSEAFLNAVNCALDELSRRVELGLTCSCVPEEIYAQINYQRIENAGIREEASSACGADISLFKPDRLVEYIKELALSPLGGGGRLELVIVKAQLMSFYRSKGYLELPAFHVYGGLVENDADLSPGRKPYKDTVELVTPFSIDEKARSSLDSGEEKAKSRYRSSHKRNQISEDDLLHKRKQRSLTELMSGKKASTLVNGGKSSTDRKATGRSGSLSSGRKRKAADSFSDDSVQTKKKRVSSLSDADSMAMSAKRSFKVGDCIRRVAGQLTGSPLMLKFSGEKFQKNAVKGDSERDKAVHVSGSPHTLKETKKKRIGIPKEYSSPDELLSQLCLAARDPMKGYSFLSVVVGFFTDFRNSIHQKNSGSGKKTGSSKTSRGKSSNSKTGSVKSNDMKDSYWTDRIIQGSSEEEPSHKRRKRKGEFQLEIPKEEERPASKRSKSLQSSSKLDSDQKAHVSDVNPVVNNEGKQEGSEDVDGVEECSPTALLLSFTEADSVPSEMDLNKIFSQYGPLKESEVLRNTKRARVVFKRRSDAEVAFSSAGKFSIFGPALVSYRLKYLSSKPKATRRSTTPGKKDATTSMESNNLIPTLPGKDDNVQTNDTLEVSAQVETEE